MQTPVRALDGPVAVEVHEGKVYFWCRCGRSQTQPFCDSSHKDTGFTPLRYQAEMTRRVFFCGCKSTGQEPLCDGSHKQGNS